MMTDSRSKLAIAALQQLESRGIYCAQFKSSASLAKSFDARTDFDVLIHEDQLQDTLSVLFRLGYHLRSSNDPNHPPGVLDVIGHDVETGAVHHFSLHTDLIFGEKRRKRHKIPRGAWQQVPLTTHEEFPIAIFTPEYECALLSARIIQRYSRKPHGRDIADSFALRAHLQEPDMVNEWDRLFSESGQNIHDASTLLFDGKCTVLLNEFAAEYSANTLTSSTMERLQAQLRRALKPFEIESYWLARTRLAAQKFKTPARIRTIRERGLVVAIVGADGAGKTTLSSSLAKWFSYKLTARRLYLGEIRTDRAVRMLSELKKRTTKRRFRRIRNALEILMRLRYASLRAAEASRAERYRDRGIIVFLDRFPFAEFDRMDQPMDRPRLDGTSLGGRLERRLFRRVTVEPDLIVVLDIDPELAIQRKPGRIEAISAKSHAVKSLARNRSNIVLIDAAQDVETVFDIARRAVWDRLAKA